MKKVMVVDDEQDTLELVGMALKTGGYDVVTASSGKECLEKLETDKPDFIILDMKMPEMDGEETLKKIRAKDAKIPVAFLSAVKISPAQDMILTAEYNIRGYLFKPITKSELLARLREII